MARNTLVINCDTRETRVALIEDGVIAELHIERAASRSTVGNIVLGRVSRVLPGMQAAFIDVGMERAAFLHVEDLIKPADFEAYLSGNPRGDDDEPSGRGAGGRRKQLPRPGLLDEEDVDDDDDSTDSENDDDAEDDDEAADSDAEDEDDEDGDDDAADDNADSDADDDEDESGNDVVEDSTDSDAEGAEDADNGDEADDSDAEGESGDRDGTEDDASEDESGEDGEDVAASSVAASSVLTSEVQAAPEASDPAASSSVADAPEAEASGVEANDGDGEKDAPPEGAWADETVAGDEANAAPTEASEAAGDEDAGRSKRVSDDSRGRRRRGRRRRGGRSAEGGSGERRAEASGRGNGSSSRGNGASTRGGRSGRSGRSGRGGDRRGNDRRGKKKATSRVSRSVPITEVVKEGDEVVVQITKEPIGTKGARVSSHVSLPGRYAVYLPTVEHVGISKRIGGGRERSRLRDVIDSLKPAMGGLIVRTVAEGLTKKQLKADVGYLMKLWADIANKKKEAGKSPAVLYAELDIVLKTARDLFTDEIETIVVDDKDQYTRLVRFVEMFLPARVKDIHLYQGQEPIFDAYGIEDEIGRALSRKVPLPSGGYLVIDQAEALAAIDVNTGRFIGKGSKDLEETAMKTNLEAVEEIAYQLRFRNIGGLVILDLIDMEVASNRDKVYRALEQRLAKDKAKTTINRISELGLLEMTRKRTRESLSRTMNEPCFYCDGTGQIQSRQTIAYEILRQIRRERASLPGYNVTVNAHPAIIDILQTEEKEAVQEAERRYMRRIELVPRTEYHIEQFDLQGT